jgi:hypothetical protein
MSEIEFLDAKLLEATISHFLEKFLITDSHKL